MTFSALLSFSTTTACSSIMICCVSACDCFGFMVSLLSTVVTFRSLTDRVTGSWPFLLLSFLLLEAFQVKNVQAVITITTPTPISAAFFVLN
ncbi:uncharacterized protein B0P05DRAFT_523872 [Gilbertella persicaria]|uniref:uncharacterized protein n=1 Tax=Gilbertella persicaria TaxID=101096 RepID=UPI00221F49D9|nr:uncharacterized protein B0P05DRAFT_523872 [Gilbertella persicaria]KAI8094899.1 hypothetical protein B0P05DRAFT_523872 [Gilbertella persicaria]